VLPISFKNVTARAQGTSHIAGPTERPLEGVTLSGIRVLMTPEATPDKRATHGLVAEGVTGLRLRDVELVWDERAPEPRWQSALVVKNARDLELSGFVGQAAPGAADAPAVVLEDVDGALVHGCRAMRGRFLYVAGASRTIHLVGNDLSAAATPVSYASDALRCAVTLVTSPITSRPVP
jgi:hypothetical protein